MNRSTVSCTSKGYKVAWECPNGCHKEPEFRVARDEVRTDTITHYYNADDGNLKDEISHRVFVGDESNLLPPQCSLCEAELYWKSELPTDKALEFVLPALKKLFDVCINNTERGILRRLGLDAGLLWVCEVCGEHVFSVYDVCDACGAVREEEDEEDEKNG